jgi:LacI family transcriptional regulator
MSTTGPVKLSYKFQRLRERIRVAIVNGDLKGKLPGERELARRFNANAKTVSKALSDLTSEGLLVRQVGRGTFVADHESNGSPVGRQRKFRWITATGDNHGFRENVFHQAEKLLQDKGHRLDAEAVTEDESKELPERGISPGALRDVDGLIIYASRPSHGMIADFLRRHIPLVLAQSAAPTVKTNAVSPDHSRGGFELTEHLIGLGHRQIGLVLPKKKPSFYEEAVRGYATAMRRHNIPPAEPLRITPDMAGAIIDHAYRPTGLVVADVELAVAIRNAAKTRSIRVPEDLSMTLLPEAGQDGLDELALTSYEVDPERVLEWSVQLLLEATPGSQPREIFIPGQLVDRGSVKALSADQMTDNSPREAAL